MITTVLFSSCINNILSETGLVSHAVYCTAIVRVVWYSIAIEKLPWAIKHSRVLRDPFREWHYAKIGCTAKRFEKDASITREWFAVKLLLLQPFVRLLVFPSGYLGNVRFSNESDLSLSLPSSPFLPLLSLFLRVSSNCDNASVQWFREKKYKVKQSKVKKLK